MSDDLKPVHTGDYSRRFRRLSQKSATVAEFGDCRRFLAVFDDSRTFLRQCGQGFKHQNRHFSLCHPNVMVSYGAILIEL